MTNEPINLLNPGGHDPEQHFPDFAGSPESPGHPPVNYHAYAACSGGSFHQNIDKVLEQQRPVLLLLKDHFRQEAQILSQLRKHGLPTAVSIKETGYHQIARLIRNARRLAKLRELLRLADGIITPVDELVPFYRSLLPIDQRDRVVFIPTPYPVDVPAWNLARPINERNGIFLGTRELKVPTRNHLQALIIAASLARAKSCRLTLISDQARLTQGYLESLDLPREQIRILPRLSYLEYLGEIASHRIVLQMDMSQVPGQVAGDSVLCRVPCIGGNGTVDRMLLPDFTAIPRLELFEKAGCLLEDDGVYLQTIQTAERHANELLSFPRIQAALADFFKQA